MRLRNHIVTLILGCSFFNTIAQSVEVQDITPIGFSGNFEHLQFSQTRGLLAISDKNVLYISTDTAKTWETEKLPTDTVNQFIMYKDGLTGFITNSKGAYRTLNGGITWEKLPLTGIPSKIDGYEVNLVNLYFKTKDVVFYILTNKVNGKRIYKSSDCGNTWKEVAKDIYPDYRLPVGIIVSNMHWNGETGYLYGNAFYAKTEDGGETWTKYCYEEYMYEVCQEVIYSYDNGVAVIAENQYTTNRVFCSKDGNPTEKYNVQSTDEFLKLAQEVEGHLYAVDDNGKLWHSVDSAKTWEYSEIEKDKWIYIEGLYFFNEFIGVAVSRNLTSYVTLDGGETWTKYVHEGGEGFNSIYCKNAEECFITGKKGRVFATNDGGRTWNMQDVSNDALYEIEFPTNEIGYIVGHQVLIKTIDGGLTWNKYNTKIAMSEYIDFINENIGYMGYSNSMPTISKTTNGGEKWKYVFDDTYDEYKVFGDYYPFSFRNENDGAVCASNVLLYTSDGGNTWRVAYEMPEQTYLKNVLSISDSGWLLYAENTDSKEDQFFFCGNDFNCSLIFSGEHSSSSGELQKINDTTYRFTYDTLDYISTDEGLTWNPVFTGLKGSKFLVDAHHGYSIYGGQIYKATFGIEELQVSVTKRADRSYELLPQFNGETIPVELYLKDSEGNLITIADNIEITNETPITIDIPDDIVSGMYSIYIESQNNQYMSVETEMIEISKKTPVGMIKENVDYRINGKTIYVISNDIQLYTITGVEIPIINGVVELQSGIYMLRNGFNVQKIIIH